MGYTYKLNLADIRKRYPEGSRVELIFTGDPHTSLKAGDTGTVVCVDDMGTVHINWDNGSTLGMITGVDEFRVL